MLFDCFIKLREVINEWIVRQSIGVVKDIALIAKFWTRMSIIAFEYEETIGAQMLQSHCSQEEEWLSSINIPSPSAVWFCSSS
jgi:hypothetical protein